MMNFSGYQGIFRANMALETFDNFDDWESEAQRSHFKGEAHFLRALFYFELSQAFGEVPGQTHVISDNTLVINNFNNFLLITF